MKKSLQFVMPLMMATLSMQYALANDTKKTDATATTTKTETTTATKTATTTAMPTKEEMMAEAMKAGQPSDGHKNLEPMVGKWNYTATVWMQPKGKPMVSKGTSENELVLGGRFLQQTAKGESTKDMPAYEGKGFTGYDNITKEYTSEWMDNMSTGKMEGTATYDAKTKTFAEKGTYSCPIRKKTVEFQGKWTLKNKDNYKYETFEIGPDGKEFKTMEIAYQRAK